MFVKERFLQGIFDRFDYLGCKGVITSDFFQIKLVFNEEFRLLTDPGQVLYSGLSNTPKLYIHLIHSGILKGQIKQWLFVFFY